MIDRYRNYRPRYNQVRKTKNTHHRWRYVLFIMLLTLGIKYNHFFMNESKNTNNTTLASATSVEPKPKIEAEPITSNVWNDLGASVNNLISQNPDLDISVAVIDVPTNTKANYGFQNNFAGASTTKVLTAAAYLHDVENGKYKLSTDGKKQLKLMLNRSDNNAWEILNNKVGYSNLNLYAKSIGLQSFNWKGNVITAGDEALLLQKLYKRELLNEENTTLILSHMQNTNNEDMIPKVIPQGATIWHKYGQLEDRLHDAAIIDYSGRQIVIVIYTKGGAGDGSNYISRVGLIKTIADTIIKSLFK